MGSKLKWMSVRPMTFAVGFVRRKNGFQIARAVGGPLTQAWSVSPGGVVVGRRAVAHHRRAEDGEGAQAGNLHVRRIDRLVRPQHRGEGLGERSPLAPGDVDATTGALVTVTLRKMSLKPLDGIDAATLEELQKQLSGLNGYALRERVSPFGDTSEAKIQLPPTAPKGSEMFVTTMNDVFRAMLPNLPEELKGMPLEEMRDVLLAYAQAKKGGAQ